MREAGRIRPASVADLSELAALAARTFPLAAPAHVTDASLRAFIAEHLSIERLGEHLDDPRADVLVAEDPERRLIGYCLVTVADQTAELSKIYVDPAHHGSGVAAHLLREAISAARGHECTRMRLGVNRENRRAQRFYAKVGFEQVGTRRFRVGDGLEHDFVLERDLDGALDLQGVSLVRGGRDLLSDVWLGVGRTEQWALLGPNGAGKSSLLSICAAEVFPSRGTASVLGSQMGRVDLRELRRRIGVVDPRHNLASNLTTTEVVLTGITGTKELVPHWSPTAEDLNRAADLESAFGLKSAEERRWLTMSQGERGRTLIARALMAAPDLLLLDEPSTGLDLPGRELMLRAIDELPRTAPGLTTVVVTHHFEELPRGTTHAALIRDGRITAAGPIEDVLTSEQVSECFAHPIQVERTADGRWRATA